jgi:hypothetical protein
MLASQLDPSELRERVAMHRLVSGEERPPHAADRLRKLIGTHDLRAICLARAATEWSDLTAVLRGANFERVHADADYEVWVAP